MLRCIPFLALLLFCECGGDNQVFVNKDETILFRTSEDNLIFSLEIDGDFKYHDSLLNRDVPLGFPIGTYKKKKDSSVIHLSINGKDTVFKYPLFEVDSILFGLTEKRNFYIATNRNKNAWIFD
jgi:hypothetical protein